MVNNMITIKSKFNVSIKPPPPYDKSHIFCPFILIGVTKQSSDKPLYSGYILRYIPINVNLLFYDKKLELIEML